MHRLLARLPAILREQGRDQLLVLTTNYDVLVERAFEEAGEQYDVVWYEAKPRGPEQGTSCIAGLTAMSSPSSDRSNTAAFHVDSSDRWS